MADLSGVPAELRREPRWVCWRREERNGKTTKLPVCAANGRMAKSTDPATWATFEEAVAAVGRWRCDGVGFVFGPDRAYTQRTAGWSRRPAPTRRSRRPATGCT